MQTKQQNRWKRLNVSYENYQKFIAKKDDRFKLTLIDLLYVSNFIGGNATIDERESEVNEKLILYSDKLREITKEFPRQKLSALTDSEIDILIEKIKQICNLTNKKATTNVKGFSIMSLTVLLSSYFPDLIPILNKVVTEKDKIKGYLSLIRKIAKQARKEPDKTLRNIDFEFYTK